MTIEERWAWNRGVWLHYLDGRSNDGDFLLPLVYVHGAIGRAEDFRSEMEVFAPRRCISLSRRGMGQSDAPATGYSFDDQVSDVEAVITASGVRSVCVMAYSVGVPIALGYAIRHPEVVRALILLDYPASYPAFSEDWAARILADTPAEPAKRHVIRGLQRESAEVQLWGCLETIRCPVLIVRGGINGVLTAEQAERFKSPLPEASVVTFVDSGHELWKPDYDRFIETVRSFLSSIE